MHIICSRSEGPDSSRFRPKRSIRSTVEAKSAAIMGEYQRDAFIRGHDLDRPTEQACVAPLIDGRDKCPHNPVEEDDDPKVPPHRPPAADHSKLWLDAESSPALFGMHVYPDNIELLGDVVEQMESRSTRLPLSLLKLL